MVCFYNNITTNHQLFTTGLLMRQNEWMRTQRDLDIAQKDLSRMRLASENNQMLREHRDLYLAERNLFKQRMDSAERSLLEEQAKTVKLNAVVETLLQEFDKLKQNNRETQTTIRRM